MDSYNSSGGGVPVHVLFFMVILLMFLGLSWYVNYEPVVESVLDQMKTVVMVSPLLLLLLVHCFSNHRSNYGYLLPFPDHKDSLHTPWGLAFVLVFLLFMVSYQSYFQQRWFPLLAR
ncbi:uncharacterized protein LOC110810341 [Carica papaya]|uniref:uncharacterized protein LOC110810341 n=1 Tax=Carica papaya TaxID=3649 RepID=UPI000B8CE780|nr:uncharacterized protein LOC110810341 [Carica papaya]